MVARARLLEPSRTPRVRMLKEEVLTDLSQSSGTARLPARLPFTMAALLAALADTVPPPARVFWIQ